MDREERQSLTQGEQPAHPGGCEGRCGGGAERGDDRTLGRRLPRADPEPPQGAERPLHPGADQTSRQVGKIAWLRAPRDREGTFLTEVFARYRRMTRLVKEAAPPPARWRPSEGLPGVWIAKDAVSRVAQRLEEKLSAWRSRPLTPTRQAAMAEPWQRCVVRFALNVLARGQRPPEARQGHGWARVPVGRRTEVVGAFPNEGSPADLAAVVRVMEDWAFRRYVGIAAEENPTKSRLDSGS